MTIICIGDSHSSFFSGLGTKEETYMQPIYGHGEQKNIIPYFKGIRIGPATAYQLERKKPILDFIIQREVKDNDKILFCFGEVDCRIHLPKRILEGESVANVVSECVERYFKVILTYRNCAVWGIIGSNPPELEYPEEYRIGTMEFRNSITMLFNDLLKEKCKEHDIPFINIFDKMVIELKTNPEYIQDHIHLSQTVMPIAIELFKEQKLIS